MLSKSGIPQSDSLNAVLLNFPWRTPVTLDLVVFLVLVSLLLFYEALHVSILLTEEVYGVNRLTRRQYVSCFLVTFGIHCVALWLTHELDHSVSPLVLAALCAGPLLLLTGAFHNLTNFLFIQKMRDTDEAFTEPGGPFQDTCSILINLLNRRLTRSTLAGGKLLLTWIFAILILTVCLIIGEIGRKTFWKSLRSKDPLGSCLTCATLEATLKQESHKQQRKTIYQ